MGKRLFRVTAALLAALLCFSLAACGESEKAETKVTFSVYENNGSELISFYTTVDERDYDSEWEYSVTDESLFETFYESSEKSDSGFLGLGKGVQYDTLVLLPRSEGSAELTYTLKTEGEPVKRVFRLTVTKDAGGIFRIKAE